MRGGGGVFGGLAGVHMLRNIQRVLAVNQVCFAGDDVIPNNVGQHGLVENLAMGTHEIAIGFEQNGRGGVAHGFALVRIGAGSETGE